MLLLFTGSVESTDLLFWQLVVEHHRYFGGIGCHNSLCACLGMFHSSRKMVMCSPRDRVCSTNEPYLACSTSSVPPTSGMALYSSLGWDRVINLSPLDCWKLPL